MRKEEQGMKKEYKKAEINVVEFEKEDIMNIQNPTSNQMLFYELDGLLFVEEE